MSDNDNLPNVIKYYLSIIISTIIKYYYVYCIYKIFLSNEYVNNVNNNCDYYLERCRSVWCFLSWYDWLISSYPKNALRCEIYLDTKNTHYTFFTQSSVRNKKNLPIYSYVLLWVYLILHILTRFILTMSNNSPILLFLLSSLHRYNIL